MQSRAGGGAARRGRFIPDFEIAGLKQSELGDASLPQRQVGRGGGAASALSAAPATREPDLSAAIDKARRDGQLHIANRRVTALPWLLMFPDEGDAEDEDDGVTAKIGSASAAAVAATPQRTGRKLVPLHGRSSANSNCLVDLSGGGGDGKKAAIKFWEGHPIQSLDCSSNMIADLLLTAQDRQQPQQQRWARLGETLKNLQASNNALVALPSMAPFSLLLTLNVSRNNIRGGDLCQMLLTGGDGRCATAAAAAPVGPPIMPHLQELVVSHNQFDSAIGLLQLIAPNLRVLRANNCALSCFSLLLPPPPQEGAAQQQQPPFVSSLRECDISHNRLAQCGFFLTSFRVETSVDNVAHPCLELLDASFNSLDCEIRVVGGRHPMSAPEQQQQQHPAWRQHLLALKTLHLRKAGIRGGAQCDTLPQLNDLNISENALTVFPDLCVATRQRVAAIDVSSNAIESLESAINSPASAATFRSLARLDVGNNNLRALDPHLCLVPALAHIHLAGNPLRSIRRSIVDGNAADIKAYLRSRLDLAANDDVVGQREVQLQMAMDQKQHAQAMLQQQQQQAADAAQAAAPVVDLSRQRRQGGGGAAGGVCLLGVVNGKTWDLSRALEVRGVGAVTSRGLALPGAHPTSAAGIQGGNATPLLPSVLSADVVADVASTFAHVRQCTALKLDGQTRLQSLTPDFFARVMPELDSIECCHTAIDNLAAILGPFAGAPRKLRSLVVTHAALRGHFPVEWCRPAPPEEQCLVTLDLSCNQLSSLCEEIGLAHAYSLRAVNFSENRLREFPTGLLHLRFLAELSLAGNGMAQLPPVSFAQHFPQLTLMDLSRNDFARLPQAAIANALGHFADTSLRSLRLEQSGIRWLQQKLLEGPSGPLLAALRDRAAPM